MTVRSEGFGKNQFGEAVTLYTLENDTGMAVAIMDHGGTIVRLEFPGRDGQQADLVLGHDRAEDYGEDTPYFGCVAGRYANRIKDGSFSLDGESFTLACNNGPHALHGGVRGFDKVVWKTEILEQGNALRMTYVSADGEEGYPGEVTTIMTYTLTDDNELKIDYHATTTKATPYNVTNHSYFNLAGHDAGDVGRQLMMINAEHFLPTDETAIPYGSESPVAGTPFDFRTPEPIGSRINAEHEQLTFAGGYDHNFCLHQSGEGPVYFAARAEDPDSGRVMTVSTSEPGIQFYTANFLDATLTGKGGYKYGKRGGFCLETQHYPNSPNMLHFPNTILRPGEEFNSQTIYQFSILDKKSSTDR